LISLNQQRKIQTMNINRKQDGLEIEISGEAMVSGIQPFLVSKTRGDATNAAANSNQEESLLVNHKLINNNQIALFSVNAGNRAIKGTDSIGLSISGFPGLKTGIALNSYMPNRSWTRPSPFNQIADLEESFNHFLYWQNHNGTYAAMMPLVGEGFCSVIGRDGKYFEIKSVSKKDTPASAGDIPIVAIAFGNDFYKMIEDLIDAVMAEMGLEDNLRRKKTFPAILEKVGWCSWNALGYDVTAEKLVAVAKGFYEQGFPLRFMLIDDGWLTVDDEKLVAFHPDEKKFPGGFRPLVEELKQYGVEHLGVWHTMNAYWEGIKKDSELYNHFKDDMHTYNDRIIWLHDNFSDMYMPSPLKGAATEFFDQWYSYLKSEGISFVKVDNQDMVSRAANENLSLQESGALYEKALQDNAFKHFNGNIINCFDMVPAVLYHFGSSALARGSEDYFPSDNDDNYKMAYSCNAAAHVLMCQINSIWFSQFVFPDFDMFQTHRPNAEFHAIARAISGGPAYITDEPGKQNVEILKKLALNNGQVLRADQPSRPTLDCIFQIQEHKPFKAFSTVGKTGLLGAWNVANADKVIGTFSPADVVGLQGDRFAVFEHFSRKLVVADYSEQLPLALDRMDKKLFIIAPIENEFAAFGLVNKYNAPKTILSLEQVQNRVIITVPEGGMFAAYSGKEPVRILVNNLPLNQSQIEYADKLLLLQLDDFSGEMEIKIEF
jgi:raffinose synthase